jgi:Domain of unknown function (DUF1737)
MEYKILMSDKKHELEEYVNSYLDNGWELAGSLVVVHAGSSFNYFQPLIKKEE